MESFNFERPADRPTPSLSPKEMKTVMMSYYDLAKIIKIAEHVSYSLAHLNAGSLTFRSETIGELNRTEVADCIQDFINSRPTVKAAYNEKIPFTLRAQTVDNIRTLLFDFEVWLAGNSKKLDSAGSVFYHIKNDFEHCRLIRRSLSMMT